MKPAKALPLGLVLGLLGTSGASLADDIYIGNNARVHGNNGVQTVVAIGSRTSAIAETGAVTGNVRVGRNVTATGRTRSQTVIALGRRADAYAGTGTVSGNVSVGGSIRVHGSTRHQVAVDIGGIPDFGLFSYSCVGCVTRR